MVGYTHHFLDDLLLLPVPEPEKSAVFVGDFCRVKSVLERVWFTPARADHDIVARLVPKVIAELSGTVVLLPATFNIEFRINQNKSALSIAIFVAHVRN